MPFSLVATLPLGTYRGHRPDGTTERYPSVARLHAALLCAAGFGPCAVERDGDIEPSPEDVAALRWLEENPPTEVSHPAVRMSRAIATAYRDDGTIGKSAGTKAIRKLAKQDVAVAVDGPDPPMPQPTHRRHRHPQHRTRRLAACHQHQPAPGQLAVHHHRRPHQTPTPIPKQLAATVY
jgi:CRISPR-associated protein Csb2